MLQCSDLVQDWRPCKKLHYI